MSKEIIDHGFGVIEIRETFYTEETIKQKDQKISDLEANLAELNKEPLNCSQLENGMSLCVIQKSRIKELEAKLAESEEAIKYLKGIKRYDIGEMLTENAKLKQQLAEKELVLDKILTEIHTNCYSGLNIVHFKEMALNDLGGLTITHNQDKISFAVEQLEKVKETLIQNADEIGEEYKEDYFMISLGNVKNIIDNQIEELKKEIK